MTSPTQRTLAWCKEHGLTVQVVERWCSFSRRRIDLFGCVDLVMAVDCSRAYPPGERGIYGIQACAGASHAARRTKSIAEPRLRTWLLAGGRFAVVSWAKRGERGKRKLWTMRWEEIRLEDLP